jgi:hypothetical protein
MSNTFLKGLATVLLLVNGVGALMGGGNLIAHPDGSSLKMPLYLLQYSPFKDFFIPGIMLFVTSGLGSMLALLTIIFKVKKSYLFVVAEGAILTGWIVIQVTLIRSIGTLHYVFGGVGLLLMLMGYLLRRDDAPVPPKPSVKSS